MKKKHLKHYMPRVPHLYFLSKCELFCCDLNFRGNVIFKVDKYYQMLIVSLAKKVQ